MQSIAFYFIVYIFVTKDLFSSIKYQKFIIAFELSFVHYSMFL